MGKINKGAFKKTPAGTKTQAMLTVQESLEMTLEEDYMEFYFKTENGQRALAKRWGVQKTTIFEDEPEKGRRSWRTMLGLPRKPAKTPSTRIKKGCEICNETPIQKAHWIPDKPDGGGTQFYNIIKLCGTHHDKLDKQKDEATIIKVQIPLITEDNKMFQISC